MHDFDYYSSITLFRADTEVSMLPNKIFHATYLPPLRSGKSAREAWC